MAIGYAPFVSMDESYAQVLDRLSRSKFRGRFRLSGSDLEYIKRQGLVKIREHASDFIGKRLKPAFPSNDGKQTPFSGHPVFKAQHATATCCRGCLSRWHRIPKGAILDQGSQDYAVGLIMAWIRKNMVEAPRT